MLAENIRNLTDYCKDKNCILVAVTKTHPVPVLKEAWDLGLKVFGENKVQEMVSKYEALPKDIEWHLIGHLQRNKVKYIAPFVALIHSVDSIELLEEINKQGSKHHRVIKCLLQVYIAQEETKYGLDYEEVGPLIRSAILKGFKNVEIVGLMGMASNTTDQGQIRAEFRKLKVFYDALLEENPSFQILSMGMSGDYKIAIEEGSSLVRVGSAIFGSRG